MPSLNAFDTVFSMGVLYHRRSPIDFLHQLKSQLKINNSLNKRRKSAQKKLKAMIAKLDTLITLLIREQLEVFKTQMLSNFERSEQGLVHVFQEIAESNNKQKNKLDGRYK